MHPSDLYNLFAVNQSNQRQNLLSSCDCLFMHTKNKFYLFYCIYCNNNYCTQTKGKYIVTKSMKAKKY